MDDPLTAADRKELHKLLRDLFTPAELLQLARLDLSFDTVQFAVAVNFAQDQNAVAFQFVTTAEMHGRVPDLVRAVRAARPLSEAAKSLASRYGGRPVEAAADPERVRYAAGQFNQAFVDRRRVLERLAMYKELHDILHQLGNAQGELARLVAAARVPGYDPLDAGDMPRALGQWLDKADRPDRLRRKWVPGFVRAARLVARCVNGEAIPPAEADRELALLETLPAQEQGGLNERLVDTAEELDAEGLGGPLRTLTAALGPGDGGEFQRHYDQFRRTCEELTRLTGEHNGCQRVEGALFEAKGLLRQAAAGVAPRWGEVRACLAQVAASRSGDAAGGATIERLTRMVDRLAAAGPAVKDNWLPDLRAAFGTFFFGLDADLLDATDRVLRTAEVLDFRLRGYSQ